MTDAEAFQAHMHRSNPPLHLFDCPKGNPVGPEKETRRIMFNMYALCLSWRWMHHRMTWD